MATYANQKTVVMVKNSNAKARYTMIPYKEQMIAAILLDGNTYKLWTFLVSNANLYTFDFSSAYFSKILGLSKNTVKTAMLKLVETTYLVKKHNNTYHMFLTPQNKNILDSVLTYIHGGEDYEE
jgi:hypothetical protein